MDRETRKLRAKQVGMLMRAYRLGYSRQGQDGRLSQTDLIGLMAEQNPKRTARIMIIRPSLAGRGESLFPRRST